MCVQGELTLGDTVVPMYVDQSRDALNPDKTVYDEIAEGREEVDLNGRTVNTRAYCSWVSDCQHTHTRTHTHTGADTRVLLMGK